MSTFCHSINSAARCQRLSTMIINQSCTVVTSSMLASCSNVGRPIVQNVNFLVLSHSRQRPSCWKLHSNAEVTPRAPVQTSDTQCHVDALWSRPHRLRTACYSSHWGECNSTGATPKSTCNRLVGQAHS